MSIAYLESNKMMSIAYLTELAALMNIANNDDYLYLIPEKYHHLTTENYDSNGMLNLLDDAIDWAKVSRQEQAAKFNRFLDDLPTFDKCIMNDMDKWAAEGLRAVNASMKKEFEGMANANWTFCANAVDLIDFVEMFIVPRLRAQMQRRYASLPDLRARIMNLWYSKLTDKEATKINWP